MAWNEPGNGQRDSWNRNKQSGGERPDLDALIKRLQKYLNQFGRGPGSLLTVVLAACLAWLLLGSYTVIGTNQSGVVLRFGSIHVRLVLAFI